ncbi:RsmE family RNA methyltransferase [Candidatus Xianfuyuplasma coldseepsis]|uniref:Ribosomal RNA small subunit methyltransferase E n=1 Tax=Candidatus Xianfuyuplasma coldseepsis TaxID=2782163 RepID=A0A7L7KTH4_9MOLU|nr:RsmE family RNA methyltransferase [Xianfuyuplasma coldseepsis]QMS85915.1 16S rRNA (uracil(1498)-N(3))-methyltransferase [Xianfuyuplasma coldseepsis]
MQRYFIDKEIIPHQVIELVENYHHIKHVIRFSTGSNIILCDSKGQCYDSVITDFTDHSVRCIPNALLTSSESSIDVDIAQGLIRRERLEYMIQKSTELGVRHIFPTIMTRSIVKIEPAKESQKLKRWNTIAKEASEQSHRSEKAQVLPIHDLRDIPFKNYDVIIVAYEDVEEHQTLPQTLAKPYQSILLVIGPEGGLGPKDIAILKHQPNAHFVSLGHRILRSETASSYLLSVISYLYEMGSF